MASLGQTLRVARSFPMPQFTRPAVLFRASRSASTQAAEAVQPGSSLVDLEEMSTLHLPSLEPEDPRKRSFRPWKRAKYRNMELPGSRYQYHPPKYYKGPLHPVQSILSSEPTARDFVPGPFSLPRLRETYNSVLAGDIMTLAYKHIEPGTVFPEPAERLRPWDGSSPYHKNRPLRGPRGHARLPIVEKDITFRNIPAIRGITIAMYQPDALRDLDVLVVARSALLAITGVMPEITRTRSSVAEFHIQKGKMAGVKASIYGNEAYEFLDRCIHFVFPKIKDWTGIEESTGDGAGGIAFGLSSDEFALFPEIEANYTLYPAKMIPGCRVFIKTTATSDRQAKLLLQTMGLPFIKNKPKVVKQSRHTKAIKAKR